MSVGAILLVSVVLLVLNGFFVAAEFALVAAKRHRLEHLAGTGSRAARIALHGSRHLSLMLAGAQLGITLCTLALGAITKPAVASWLGPAFTALGLPDNAAYVVSFLLAVAIVGFLHVVIGEMAPKSWAISQPERSALILAPPFVAFTRLTKPVLTGLNGVANACLRLVKVTPQDELAQVHGPHELRLLLDSSREHGTIPADDHQLLTAMLQLQQTTVADIMTPADRAVSVDHTATAADIEQVSRDTGRSRLFVHDHSGRLAGIVHVRDAVRATTVDRPAIAADLMTPPLALPADLPITTAVATMRDARAQLAIVARPDDRAGNLRADTVDQVGIVALEDILEQLIGQFDDESDPILTSAKSSKHQHRAS